MIASRIFCRRCITCRDPYYLPANVLFMVHDLNSRWKLIVISTLPPNACLSTVQNVVNGDRVKNLIFIVKNQCIYQLVTPKLRSFPRKFIVISALPPGTCQNTLNNAVSDDRFISSFALLSVFFPLGLNQDYWTSVLSVLYCTCELTI